MATSLTSFRAPFLDRVLDLLWRQWSSLGVGGQSQPWQGGLIDPEALLLTTCTFGRHDARLSDAMIEWLGINGRYINVQRCKIVGDGGMITQKIDIRARPIYHRDEGRVRAHFLLCMLAYYVQWHMFEAWRPLLFADEDQEAKDTREPVAPAKRSKDAVRKASTKCLEDGTVAHSFKTLMEHLAGIVRNTCRRVGADPDEPTFYMTTPPNPKQQQAYDLLDTISV